MAAYKPITDRFWEKVEKSNHCWEWIAYKNAGGYGMISSRERPLLAHRVSYEINVGEIPDGMNVLHRCDNPRCVRPDHLFLGTLADNNADMRSKGRASGGRRPGVLTSHHVLDEGLVHEIRRLFDFEKMSMAAISRKLGFGRGAVWGVARRATWLHIKEQTLEETGAR